MTIKEFLSDGSFNLPVIQTGDKDFIDFLSSRLEGYRNKLDEVDSFDDLDFDLDRIRKRQYHPYG